MENLKPCPFCGEKPETRILVFNRAGYKEQLEFSIICPRCGATVSRYLNLEESIVFEQADSAMKEVRFDWNRRAYHECAD